MRTNLGYSCLSSRWNISFTSYCVLVISLLLAIVLSTKSSSAYQVPFGIQTGNNNDDLSSFATSIIYNEQNREIIISGSTYGSYFDPTKQQQIDYDRNDNRDSDCFVAIMRLPNNNDANTISWVRRRQYGNSGVNEFCSDMVAIDNNNDDQKGNRFITIGYTIGDDGLMSSMLPFGSSHKQIYGSGLDLDSAMELQGGMLFHSNQIQIPVSVVNDPITGDIFIAEIVSESKTIPFTNISYPYSSWIDDYPTVLQKSDGTGYSARIRRLTQKEQARTYDNNAEETYESIWIKEYGTKGLKNVMISSLTYYIQRSTNQDNMLIMTGYTSGSGNAFGEATESNNNDGTASSFVTLLSSTTGDVMNVMRIESEFGPAVNERVMGICYKENLDEDEQIEQAEIFVVGTKEDIETYTSSAFIHKIDLNTKEIIWTQRLEGVGIACAVTPDGGDVYIAGNILSGQSADTTSTDIFVAKYTTLDGTRAYTKQIGTSADDRLALGKSLATDTDGNLIVLGNTEGSLYRTKSSTGTSDIVVFTIERENGEYLVPIKAGQQDLSLSSTGNVSGSGKMRAWVIAISSICAMTTIGFFGRWLIIRGGHLNLGEKITIKARSKKHSSFANSGREGIFKTALGPPPETAKERASKFPLGAFGLGDDKAACGDVFDLLSMASKRHACLVAKEQSDRPLMTPLGRAHKSDPLVRREEEFI